MTLTIRKENSGNQVWIKGLKTTFQYFGWDQQYDEWRPMGTTPSGRYFIGTFAAKGPGGRRGGQRIRICRGLRMQGHPAGLTNCFRIHSHISNRDLAELAHFAGPQVGWMESRCGKRVEWEIWEKYYQGQLNPFHQGFRKKVA